MAENRCNDCDSFVTRVESWREPTSDERASHSYLHNTTLRVAKAKCSCGREGLAIEWPVSNFVSHAQNPSVLRRARDFYAVYCASSDGKNYQGLPCPAWDALTPAVRAHWYTVALRSLHLEAVADGKPGEALGNERACLPNDYVLGHLGDPAHALEVWSTYSGQA